MTYFKMIQQLTILLIFLFAACGQKSKPIDNVSIENQITSNDSLQTFSITKATAEDYNKAKKLFIDKSLYDTTTFKKVNGEIKLPVVEKWRPFVRFTDTLLNTDNSDLGNTITLANLTKLDFILLKVAFGNILNITS